MTTHRDDRAGETMVVHPPSPGGPLRVELTIAARHRPPPAHVHPAATERFTVTDGALEIRVGRRWSTVPAGGGVVVPAGTVHAYRGVPGSAARVLVELVPPGGMAEFFAAFYGVPEGLRGTRTGAPRLRAMAPILLAHDSDIALPGLPRPLARALLRLLS